MHLRQHGIERIILAGMTAPGCVEGTGRYGYEVGYSVTLAKDATASFTREWMQPRSSSTRPSTPGRCSPPPRSSPGSGAEDVTGPRARRVHVGEGREQALLDERPAMIVALRRAFPGLVSAWLTRRDDGSWLDVILWRSREDAEYPAQHVTEIPEAAAWFTHIDQSHGIEHLTVLSPTSDTEEAKAPCPRP